MESKAPYSSLRRSPIPEVQVREDLWQELTLVREGGLKVEKALRYLPALEAEVLWLSLEKGKTHKQIAEILTLPESTTSYRFRRALLKLQYLELLCTLDVAHMVDQIFFLKPKEKKILVELFYVGNQDVVGRMNKTRQSSVKWIYLKTKRNLARAEREDPARWFNYLGLLLFLEESLKLRIVQ